MKLRRPDLVFLCTALFLCSWHLDSSFNDNTVSRAAMVAALVEDGTLSIDAYQHLTGDKAFVAGRYYSEKAPLPSLIMLPFWWLATATGLSDAGAHGLLTEGLLRWSGLFCASLPLALIMLWTWRRLRGTATPIAASWMATLPFLGSYLFIYSGSFYGHLIAALFLLYAWDRRTRGDQAMAGILVSAAVLCEYSLFVFPVVWGLQDLVMRRWRSLRNFILGGLPAVVLLLIMNALITGDPAALPYSHVNAHADQERLFGLAMPSLRALFGLFIGPYRGMFVFAPITLLCSIMLLRHLFRKRLRNILLHPLVTPCALLITMIASHSMWWGGWAMGPRHLTAVTVLLLAAGLPKLPAKHSTGWLFLALSLFGLAVNFMARSTTSYGLPTEVTLPITRLIHPAFMAGWFTDMQWPVLLGASPKSATFAFFILFILALIILRIMDRQKAQPTL